MPVQGSEYGPDWDLMLQYCKSEPVQESVQELNKNVPVQVQGLDWLEDVDSLSSEYLVERGYEEN